MTKARLDIFWLRYETLEESANLPDPDVFAQEIVEDLEAALEQFREIPADLALKESALCLRGSHRELNIPSDSVSRLLRCSFGLGASPES